MAYQIMRGADIPENEDEVYRITDSLHQAKRIAKDLIKDGWECYIIDSDSTDEWNWDGEQWEKVR